MAKDCVVIDCHLLNTTSCAIICLKLIKIKMEKKKRTIPAASAKNCYVAIENHILHRVGKEIVTYTNDTKVKSFQHQITRQYRAQLRQPTGVKSKENHRTISVNCNLLAIQ